MLLWRAAAWTHNRPRRTQPVAPGPLASFNHQKPNPMLTIWEFPLEITAKQVIQMPIEAEILTVQTQQDKPCLWAVVDSKAAQEPRCFAVYGTGHPIEGVPGEYLGTVQLRGGAFVFHVFECPNAPEMPEPFKN